MFIKPYLYSIYGKRVKSTNRLTRYLNACKGHLYPKPPHKPPKYESHNKEDVLSENWEDEGDLLGKMVTTTTANGTPKTLTEDMPWRKLFANKFLSALREEWFSNHKFPADIPISDR